MNKICFAICAGLLLTPLAAAQETQTHTLPDGTTHTHDSPGVLPVAPVQPAQPQMPPFDRMAKLGPDGKVIKLEGVLDILAIPRNNLIDAATRERIRPYVQNWLAEVDQLAIDNLDFIEKIAPPEGGSGVIDEVNINDNKKLLYVAQMMNQLMAAGPLSAHLEVKEALTRDQAQLNQQIVSDYLQQLMNQVMADNGVPNQIDQKPQTEEQKLKQVNAVSRFLYELSCRDTMTAYYRMLKDAAPVMEKVVEQMNLSADQVAKIKPLLPKAKSAMLPKDKQQATREILNQMTFDQRREALQKARELAPPYDPISQLPPQQASVAPQQDQSVVPVGAPMGGGR